ncbi:MAG: restriction endonuclease subunit S [Bacteroidales bacterium]|nr:restriction endonuclease subunit S [Bacteroidales bacterium]
MSEWKEYRLGDIVTILGGFAYKGEHIGHGEGLLLGMGCVSFKEKFLMSGARPYAGDCAERYYANLGDLVLATRQQSDNLPILGMPAIIPQELDGKKLIVGANLYRVSNNSDFSNKYLYWLLKSNAYVNHIASCKTGTTVSMITKSNVEDFVFKAPEKQERARIVSVLSSLDDKIDLLNRENVTLEALAETLFRHYFIETPNPTWKEGKLGELINIGSGKALKHSDFVNDGPYPVLGANGEIGRANEYLVNETDRVLYTGRVGTLGKVFRLERECAWLSDNTLVIKPKCHFNYVYFLLKQANLQDLDVGSTQPLIRQSDVVDIDVIIPNDSIIDVFEKEVSPLFEKIKSNQQQKQTLTAQRDALLPRLMSGEVKVTGQ